MPRKGKKKHSTAAKKEAEEPEEEQPEPQKAVEEVKAEAEAAAETTPEPEPTVVEKVVEAVTEVAEATKEVAEKVVEEVTREVAEAATDAAEVAEEVAEAAEVIEIDEAEEGLEEAETKVEGEEEEEAEGDMVTLHTDVTVTESVGEGKAPNHAHPISKVPAHTPTGDYYCCDECMATTSFMWHCQTCNYDVCTNCANGELQEEPGPLDYAAIAKSMEEDGEEDESDPYQELEELHKRLGGTEREGDKKQAPFGSWETPFTSDWLVRDVVRLRSLYVDGDDLYWTESRPSEKGRLVVVKSRFDGSGSPQDVTPSGFSARSRVHEYGGGEYTVQNGRVLFTNFTDQKLYSQTDGAAPQVLAEGRLADMEGIHDNFIYAVFEDHSKSPEPENSIVRVDVRTGEMKTLASGHNFYATPRINHAGTKLAFVAWDFPNMPWDTTALYICDLTVEGFPVNKIQGEKDESVMQPSWSNHGDTLYFLSDRTNWWNVYKYRETYGVELVLKKDHEFGDPAWILGERDYCVVAGLEDTLAVKFFDKSLKLCLLHTTTGELRSLPLPPDTVTIDAITSFVTPSGVKLAYIAGSPLRYDSIEVYDLTTNISTTIQKASNVDLASLADFCSPPVHITYPTTFARQAHGVFYQPKNKNFWGLPNTLPPLLVKIHGGPTSNTAINFRADLQYWTSRGWAVLDVDHGGSAGYGREYRTRLNGQWGIVDVDDCCAGAQFLVDQGLVDKQRLAITGGSAGGFSVLSCLVFKNTFSVGCSYFGVSDLAALAADTHKFESRYLDNLVAPYPERKDVYAERSPINHVERLSHPVIFFQGLEDPVVLPNQSRLMYEAVKNKGLPVALVEFPGEAHGFRQSENIRRSLDGEYYFFSRVFQFPPSPDIALNPFPIENMDTPSAPSSASAPSAAQPPVKLPVPSSSSASNSSSASSSGSLYPSLNSPKKPALSPATTPANPTPRQVVPSSNNNNNNNSSPPLSPLLVAAVIGAVVLGAGAFAFLRRRKH